jgi:ketosteroid isomerase-like protein
MSRADLESWRAVIEDFRALLKVWHDERTSELDREATITRVAQLWDPEIEWDASELGVPDIVGTYRGHEQVRRFWHEWLAAWETLEFDYELIDAGDRVVLLLDQRMRGRATGIEVPLRRYAHVATFRNGLIVNLKIYPSQAEALEAAGLGE